MNKKIIAAASAAAITALAPMCAAFAEDGNIEISYNGEYMTYDDVRPELISDRTMLPFRKVLETMGAEVTYDEATDTAKAVRGDTAVEFSLSGTTVTTTHGTDTSYIEMDVAPVLKNDRTLVPVRFMSEALAMNVGWDDETQTVYIVDKERYLNDISQSAPNFYALLSSVGAAKEQYVSQSAIALNTKTSKDGAEKSIDLSADIKTNKTADKSSGEVKGDIAFSGLTEELGTILSSGSADLKDVDLTFVNTDRNVFIQTNIAEKLSEQYPSSGKLMMAAAFISSDSWLKADKTKLSELTGGTSLNMTSLVSPIVINGDVTAAQAHAADALFDSAPALDPMLSVNTDGSYSITVTKDNISAAVTLLALIGADTEYSACEELEITLSGKITDGFETESSISLREKSSDSDITFTKTTSADPSAEPVIPAYDANTKDDLIMYLEIAKGL